VQKYPKIPKLKNFFILLRKIFTQFQGIIKTTTPNPALVFSLFKNFFSFFAKI